MTKSYSELVKMDSYEDRFNYLKLDGGVGDDTFGMMRYLNQALYNSRPWRNLRNKLIVRDNAMDMACEGHPIDICVLHHINPITIEDFENDSPLIWDPNNLICVDRATHNAIHYGSFELIRPLVVVDRKPNDTIPWK